MLVDFHSHTLESDGTLEPAALVAKMRERGVEVFSISDHDTLSAYGKLDLTSIAATVVPGIELNTTYRGNEVHVLGYAFELAAPELTEAIGENRRHRIARAQQMVDQLARAGAEIEFEAVRAEAGHSESTIGRPHVARALVRAGYVADIDSAFRQWLGAGKPGYVPSHYMRPQHAVELIARAGGVAVLAHPGRLRDEDIIEELVEAGLSGLETFYPSHDANATAHFRAVAKRFGLVMTAGSDFHDPQYNPRGVGMEVERLDIQPFLDLVVPSGSK